MYTFYFIIIIILVLFMLVHKLLIQNKIKMLPCSNMLQLATKCFIFNLVQNDISFISSNKKWFQFVFHF